MDSFIIIWGWAWDIKAYGSEICVDWLKNRVVFIYMYKTFRTLLLTIKAIIYQKINFTWKVNVT